MMTDLICTLWEGLRDAGLPEVMLYLPDGAACRCHWNDTAVIDGIRVALVGDQERGIVRIVPLTSCLGLGIASPKGNDPSGYKAVVLSKLIDATRSSSEPSSELEARDQTSGAP